MPFQIFFTLDDDDRGPTLYQTGPIDTQSPAQALEPLAQEEGSHVYQAVVVTLPATLHDEDANPIHRA